MFEVKSRLLNGWPIGHIQKGQSKHLKWLVNFQGHSWRGEEEYNQSKINTNPYLQQTATQTSNFFLTAISPQIITWVENSQTIAKIQSKQWTVKRRKKKSGMLLSGRYVMFLISVVPHLQQTTHWPQWFYRWCCAPLTCNRSPLAKVVFYFEMLRKV